MARPPIIISNGGVIDELAKGLVEEVLNERILTEDERIPTETEKEKVREKLKKNVKALMDDYDKTEIVVINDAGVNAPYLYWRKKASDSSYSNSLTNYGMNTEEGYNGTEGENIKNIINSTE